MAWKADPEARPENEHPKGNHADGGIPQVKGRQRHHQRADLLQIVLRHLGHLQTEKIFYLHGADGDANPGGKAQRDGERNVLDQAAKAGDAEEDQKQSGEKRGHQQPRETKLLGDRIEDHHKCRRRAGDAKARAAAEGNDNPGHRRGVEAILRRDAATDSQRHRQWNGNDADGNARHQVAGETREGISLFPACID